MFEFLHRFLARDERQGSKSVAKERLRLVLVHDRADTSPNVLEMLKEELVEVISKYMEIDRQGLEVSLSQVEGGTALMANIPVVKLRRPAN